MKKTLLLLALSIVAITNAKAQISGSWNLSRETMDGRPLHVFTASYSEDFMPMLEKELKDKQTAKSVSGFSKLDYGDKKETKPVAKPMSLEVAKELRNIKEKCLSLEKVDSLKAKRDVRKTNVEKRDVL